MALKDQFEREKSYVLDILAQHAQGAEEFKDLLEKYNTCRRRSLSSAPTSCTTHDFSLPSAEKSSARRKMSRKLFHLSADLVAAVRAPCFPREVSPVRAAEQNENVTTSASTLAGSRRGNGRVGF